MAENVHELPDELIEQIDELAEEGNRLFDEDSIEKAIEVWQKGLSLIPEPQHCYSQAAWFEVAIGDGYFVLKDYVNAERYLCLAKNNIDFFGYGNPFVMLRYGQVMLELNQLEKAKEYLLRAYGLDEDGDLFSEDDPKYFAFLKEQVGKEK